MIRYDEATHTYWRDSDDGPQRVVSVTQALTILPSADLSSVPTDLLERAAMFGRAAHRAIALDNQGLLDFDSLDALLKPYVVGWRNWLRLMGAYVVAAEHRVYHPSYDYAGTLDVVVRIPAGETCVVDVKTGSHVPKWAPLQTAAYREALSKAVDAPAKLGKRTFVVHINGSPMPTTHSYGDSLRDFGVFVSALNLYRWERGCMS